MKKGLFITLEGPDGSGKTSVALLIKEKLEKAGYEVVHTREPGGVAIAEEIRQVILNPKNTAMDAKTEALLYAASRRQHLVEKVMPAIRDGKIVLCERFVDSSLAYQGYARGIGMEQVMEINRFAIEGNMPDITLFLAIDAATGLRRIAEGRSNSDRLDNESLSFHQKVNEGYQEVLTRYQERMTIIDASRELSWVVEECYSAIEKELHERSC